MSYQYQPAKGAQYTPEQAQALGEALEKLGFTATPEQIVDAARPANSPIHDLFEWDNDAAAEAWRRQQARNHANHLLVVIRTEDGVRTTKAFHSITIQSAGGGQGYCHMVNVAENPDLAEQVIAKALAELNGWKARYAEYRTVLSGVFQAIEDAQKSQAKGKTKRRQKAGAA